MARVISRMGVVSTLSDDKVDEAIWQEGCIHIRQRAKSVIVSVDFERLTGSAIAAALYELADRQPTTICLSAGENRIIEVLVGFELAFRRICKMFANADVRENGSDTPWLFGGTSGHCEVNRQSDPETYQPPGFGRPFPALMVERGQHTPTVV